MIAPNQPCQICGSGDTRMHIGGCRCPKHDNYHDPDNFPIDDMGREPHQTGYTPKDGPPRFTLCNSWEYRKHRGLV